jgi:hypothetical protein
VVAVRLPFRSDPLYVDPGRCLITTFCVIAVAVPACLLAWQLACAVAWQIADLPAPPLHAAAANPASAKSQPGWIVTTRSSGAFDLPARDLDGQAFSYTVRRHPQGGGRQDVMAWRAPSGAQLKVVIYRPGREDGVALTPDRLVRQLGAAAGLTLEGTRVSGRLATKFGALPLVEAGLAGAGERRCLAAGEQFPGSGVMVAGFSCSAGAELVDRKRLACWLDRLTLLSSGGSEAMAALFARAELHRTDACGEAASRPAAAPSRPDWLSVQNARQDAGLRGHVALR